MSVHVRIEVQWRCQHCGHRHQQLVAIGRNEGQAGLEIVPLSDDGSACRLVCELCGEECPIQILTAAVNSLSPAQLGMSTLQRERSPRWRRAIKRRMRSARNPSDN